MNRLVLILFIGFFCTYVQSATIDPRIAAAAKAVGAGIGTYYSWADTAKHFNQMYYRKAQKGKNWSIFDVTREGVAVAGTGYIGYLLFLYSLYQVKQALR